MEHVAIDLGGRESQICVRRSDGTIREERRCRTAVLKAWLSEQPKSRVIVETCAESFAIADAAMELGHEVRVVPATLVRSLGVGAGGKKTDRRDARVLSEVSCRIDLPSVHIPSQDARRRKTLCGMREGLVGARTKLINTVRGFLRGQVKRLGTRGADTFATRIRRLYEENSATAMPRFLARQLETIDQLTVQIREADEELCQEAHGDPVCRRLMTVPGVGPVTALRLVATLDDVTRFEGPHRVASYLGLVPGERSSSDRQVRTSITKAGSPTVRWLLVQAAHCALHCRRVDPMQTWALEVAKRRGKRVAIVALARKIAGILFALWRDGSTYDPNRGATPVV